jgi:putative ABC transport system substrate-binding protein
VKRRAILQAIAALLAAPSPVFAQVPKRFRVGYFMAAKSTEPLMTALLNEFRALMAERGYVEGTNLVIDIGRGEADATRFPAVAEQLIALKPDVMIANETASRAIVAKTKTIPIVLWTSIDPVGAGLVESISRPGGNVTGMMDLYDQLVAKHVELLLELAPKAKRLGFLFDPLWSSSKSYEDVAHKAASDKRLSLTAIPVLNEQEVKQAFVTLEKQKVEILVLASMSRIVGLTQPILEGARRLRLPTILGIERFPEAGGLLSYGPKLLGNMRNVTEFVDRILKGAKPAELPLRQTAIFEMVINLRTAREIGITIPNSLLLRADRVIK